MEYDVSLDRLGRRQWGLVTAAQAREVMGPGHFRRQRDAGKLLPVHRGVYRLAGVPLSWRQRAMACCLAYGFPVAVSYRSAAVLWGLEGFLALDPEVTVPAGRSGRRPGIATHREILDTSDVTTRFNIPVTRPERMLVDLASVLSPELLEQAVDDAHRMRLTTPQQVARMDEARRSSNHSALNDRASNYRASNYRASNYRGGRVLRELLRARLAHPGVGDSVWEDRVFRWIVAAGEEPPERHVQVLLNGAVRVLDMAYPRRMIAIEFDGFEHHQFRRRYHADAGRYSELALAGWLALKVTSGHSEGEVVDRVRRALALRPDIHPPA